MGKTVLVTGGTRRLGKAISETLRARGWRVLTSSHRADAGADFVADFATPGAAERLYDEVRVALGGEDLDALVNNAALFDDTPERLKAVNLAAPCALMAKMAARTRGMGSVVNILDAAALASDASALPYARLKAQLAHETRRAARDYARVLRVNAVAPGDVLPVVGLRVKAKPRLLDRRTQPADIAEAVAFLLSAPSITGVVLPVDSGCHVLANDGEVS